MTLTTGCLFSGYGGLSMAVNAYFGSRTAWFSEYDAAPSKILAHSNVWCLSHSRSHHDRP